MNNDKKSQSEITLKDVHDILKELLKWTKFSGIKEVKPVLESHLSEDSEKLIYHLSDGSKGIQEIAKIIGNVSHSTVFRYWKEWEKSDLGESVPIAGGSRFKHLFDLEDFGIKVPPIPKQEIQQSVQNLGEQTEEVQKNGT